MSRAQCEIALIERRSRHFFSLVSFLLFFVCPERFRSSAVIVVFARELLVTVDVFHSNVFSVDFFSSVDFFLLGRRFSWFFHSTKFSRPFRVLFVLSSFDFPSRFWFSIELLIPHRVFLCHRSESIPTCIFCCCIHVISNSLSCSYMVIFASRNSVQQKTSDVSNKLIVNLDFRIEIPFIRVTRARFFVRLLDLSDISDHPINRMVLPESLEWSDQVFIKLTSESQFFSVFVGGAVCSSISKHMNTLTFGLSPITQHRELNGQTSFEWRQTE